MNQAKIVKRAQKLESRRIMAARLQGQINMLGNMLMGFVQMSAWKRFKWLVTGKF